jgi:purine-binding chemotaxis protein CheW
MQQSIFQNMGIMAMLFSADLFSMVRLTQADGAGADSRVDGLIRRGESGMDQSTQSSNATATSAQLLQLVSFSVAAEEYGLDILRVQEIIRTQQLTRVPNLPDYVEGVINLRGKVIPVVALRRRLGLQSVAPDKNTRIVVVDVHGQTLGFIVDAVSEVLRIRADTVEPTPRIGTVEREYISGVGKLESRLLLMLDLERLMNEAEIGATVQ